MVNLEWIEDLGWSYLRQADDVLLKEQSSRRFDNKSHKWVPDSAEGFVPAPVTVVEGKELTIRMSNNEKVKVNFDDAQAINPAKYDKAEDLATLLYLNEASLLHTLRQRFSALLTYTYAGTVCIFVNPYKQLPIYTESVAMMYLGQRPSEMPPHLFAIADHAYRNMIHEKRNQVVIVTGESGSGKTENINRAIFYYTQIGGDSGAKQKKAVRFQDQVVRTFAHNSHITEKSLEHRLLEVNHLCATFGNAATGRNTNSSRYERYVRLYFNALGKLAGCEIQHFLLERSRVIKQFPEERSFHIFYQIVSNRKLCEICLLERDINKYAYVSQAETRCHGMDDSDDFKHTDKALNSLGFTVEDRTKIYKICAGILRMGQLKTKTVKNTQLIFDDDDIVQKLCRLFDINQANFTDSILKPNLKGNIYIHRSRTTEQVQFLVSNVACTTYSLLFSWLISRFNEILKKDGEQDLTSCIGLLDIAGFEKYPYNTFERYWINFVNERLQQYFNSYMFVIEQEEYKRNGVNWEYIDFGHNLQPCIDLLDRPNGILGILSNVSLDPNGNNDILYKKLNASFSERCPYYRPGCRNPNEKNKDFVVLHYAGQVCYSVDDWVEKDRCGIDESVVAVFRNADKKSLVSTLWSSYPDSQTKSEKVPSTFTTTYTASLSKLVKELATMQPHFIRCILPNDLKQSAVFDGPLVLNQLSCNGILEELRICRNGFPDRLLFAEFRRRYAIVAMNTSKEMDDKSAAEVMCKKLLQEGTVKVDQVQLGHTKIFFKYGLLRKLEGLREAALSDVIIRLQSACRYYLARLRYLSLDKERCAIISIQKNVSAWTQMQNSPWLRLYFHVKPLIPLLNAKKEFEELRQKIEESEQSMKVEADAKALFQEELNKGRENFEEMKHKFEEEKKQYQKEKEELLKELDKEKSQRRNSESSARLVDENERLKKEIKVLTEELTKKRDIDSDVLEELGKKNLKHHNGESNEKLVNENRRLKNEIEALTKKLAEKQEIIDSKSVSKMDKMLDNERTEVKEDVVPEDAGLGTSKMEEPDFVSKRNPAFEELESMRRRCERLETKKAELQELADDYEHQVQSLKHAKDDLAAAKKRLETELRQVSEQNELIRMEKINLEETCKKTDTQLLEWKSHLNHDADLINKLQINTKKLIARIEELERELQDEQHSRLRAEKQREDLQEELSIVNDQIYETNEQLNTQMQINKLRQVEINGLQRKIEEHSLSHEKGMADMRSMHWLTVNNLRNLTVQEIDLLKEKTELWRNGNEESCGHVHEVQL